eukprot:366425-Chlamydomonas_euryale.AAC.7
MGAGDHEGGGDGERRRHHRDAELKRGRMEGDWLEVCEALPILSVLGDPSCGACFAWTREQPLAKATQCDGVGNGYVPRRGSCWCCLIHA